MHENDTIAAVSTPPGEGGVSIIRISGPKAFEIAEMIFVGTASPRESPSHRVLHGQIREPGSGELLDEVLLVVMRAPHTFTAEDVVEINGHGGIFVTERVLEVVVRCGARLAEPGEFTKRAFLNGRMDLAQAEAVLDIIRSRTQAGLSAGLDQLSGRFSEAMRLIREEMVAVLAELERAVDFSEEGQQPVQRDRLAAALEKTAHSADMLIESSLAGKLMREGAILAIGGKPNVGKSSLMNVLLREDRAIVSSIPGTTRDAIVERWSLGGIPLQIVDTAGLGPSGDAIEQESGRRARENLKNADLVLFVLDGSKPFDEQDSSIAGSLVGRRHISVINKRDLKQEMNLDRLRAILSGPVVMISALKGTGLEELEKIILQELFQGPSCPRQGVVVTHVRHRNALERCRGALLRAVGALQDGLSEEFVALDLREALVDIGEITGETSSDEVLDRIFSQFCIGK